MIKCDSTNDVNSPMSKEMKNGKDNFNTKGNITIARTLGIIVEAHMLVEKLPQKVNPIKPHKTWTASYVKNGNRIEGSSFLCAIQERVLCELL